MEINLLTMTEQITFLNKKPETIVKYGKVIIMNQENQYERETMETLNMGTIEKNN